MRLSRSILVACLAALASVAVAQAPGESPGDGGALPEGIEQSWFARVQAGIREGEYRFQLGPASYRPGRGEVFQAPNRALDLRLYLDAEGVEVLERSSEGAPTVMRLALAGWGRAGAMDRSAADALLESDQVGAWLGLSVSTAGDVNGDGFADVIVGAYNYDNGQTNEGAALVFLGSAAGIVGSSPADAHALLESNQATTFLGGSVSTAGDVNSDGFADVIVGAPYYDNGQNLEGAALVFLGSSEGRPVRAQQLAGPGDEPIQPWAVSGLEGGFAVRMQATSPRGRELVRLQLEACPSGIAFGQVQCTTWLSPEWVDTTASPGGVELEAVSPGLVPGELYRWRARTLYQPISADQPGVSPPPNPAHGPWRRLGAQAEEADIRGPFSADLTVTVDDGQTTAVPGETVSYTITASNPGPTPVTGALVSDVLPAALVSATWTCAGAGGGVCTPSGSGDIADTVDLPLGASVTYSLTATIDPDATGLLSNTATVSVPAGFIDTEPADNTATDTDDLTPTADLAITKDDGQTTAVPGEQVTYTIVVSNASGPSTMAGSPVSDVFPAELIGVTWTCTGSGGGVCASPSGAGTIDETADLPPGASVTYTATGTIDPAATGALVNAALVLPPGRGTDSARGTDPVPSNNSATDVDILTPEADLAITKDDGQTTAVPGLMLTYTIVATNPGPSTVPGAMVADTFPAELIGVSWTCTGSGGASCTASGAGDIADSVDLPAGASVTYTAKAVLDAVASGTLLNTATVECPASVTELEPADNTDTDSDTVVEVLFADGFDSSNTSAWSLTVP
jgi:uncharacterized repeat protein (TIGR01451 family)